MHWRSLKEEGCTPYNYSSIETQRLYDLESHVHPRTLYLLSDKRMALFTALEECEHSSSSPCLQVGCQHQESSSVKAGHSKPEQGNTEPSAFLPDPVQIFKLHSERSSGVRLPKTGSGKSRESDKYVPMKWYRPGSGEESKFKSLVSETPVLITDLRLAEQNIAYDTILENLPADKIQEYYDLHLQCLKGIREAIVDSEAVMQRFQLCFVRHRLHVNGVRKAIVDKGMARFRESMDMKAEIEAGGGEEGKEEQRVWEGFLAFRRAIKERKKLQTCERAVARLLVRCEDAGKEILGFSKVVWQAD